MLKQYLNQLAKELWGTATEEFVKSEEGTYNLTFSQNLVVSLKEAANQSIILVGTVAPYPSKKQEEFLLKAMEANLLGRETGENVLALTPDGKQVILTHCIPQEADYRTFRDALEEFINYLESWRIDTVALTQEI